MNTIDASGAGHGGTANVGGIVGSVTGPELGIRGVAGAPSGANTLMYSGKDNSATSSHAYTKAYGLTNATVRPTSDTPTAASR